MEIRKKIDLAQRRSIGTDALTFLNSGCLDSCRVSHALEGATAVKIIWIRRVEWHVCLGAGWERLVDAVIINEANILKCLRLFDGKSSNWGTVGIAVHWPMEAPRGGSVSMAASRSRPNLSSRIISPEIRIFQYYFKTRTSIFKKP